MTKAWDDYREVITRLYMQERRTLNEVRKIMAQEYDFQASSYRQKFEQWRLNKYNCKKRNNRRRQQNEGSLSNDTRTQNQFQTEIQIFPVLDQYGPSQEGMENVSYNTWAPDSEGFNSLIDELVQLAQPAQTADGYSAVSIPQQTGSETMSIPNHRSNIPTVEIHNQTLVPPRTHNTRL